MALKELAFAISVVVATPSFAHEPTSVIAPAGTAETKYCMWVEPMTGSRLETVQCYTREQWAEADVDVDKDWPKEGVRIIEG